MIRIRRPFTISSLIRVAVTATILAFPLLLDVPQASAVSGFNAGHIIDDGIFEDASAMNVSTIQQFLNAEVPTCDTSGTQSSGHSNGAGGYYTRAQWGAIYDSENNTNIGAAPYVCLKSYVENPSTGQNNLQNPSASISGGESAAQIIYNAAQAYTINPEVLITTIQKEQGLITDDWPWLNEYTEAMGYNCPDDGGCSGYAGFYQQVTAGAKQFRNYLDNPTDFNYVVGNDKVAYSPSCAGSTIYIQNQATAALYDYTPYQPDANVLAATNPIGSSSGPGGAISDSCAAYGNRNFWWYFNTWFGSSLASGYDYSYVSSSTASLTLEPGQIITGNSVTIRNTGTATWYADGSVPTGQHPVRLAMRNYQDTPFADPNDPSWLGTSNQIEMTPATVAPGATATFTFDLMGPSNSVLSSPYTMWFVPVVDGVEFMPDDNMGFVINNKVLLYSVKSSLPSSISLLPNQTESESISIENTGVNTWYADGSVPTGQHPVRLAMRNYQDTPFADPNDPSWLGTSNQIEMTPATVAPGATATFTFDLMGPFSAASQTLTFIPVLDGVAFADNEVPSVNISTPQPNYNYQYVTAVNPPSSMTEGSTANVSLTLKNTGNVIWTNESTTGPGTTRLRLDMRRPTYVNSPFYDPSAGSNWLLANQIAYTGPTVMPSQTATFNFTWKAPDQTGNFTSYFAPVLDGYYQMADIGMGFAVNVTP